MSLRMMSKGYGVLKFQKDLDLEVKMVQCGEGGDAPQADRRLSNPRAPNSHGHHWQHPQATISSEGAIAVPTAFHFHGTLEWATGIDWHG